MDTVESYKSVETMGRDKEKREGISRLTKLLMIAKLLSPKDSCSEEKIKTGCADNFGKIFMPMLTRVRWMTNESHHSLAGGGDRQKTNHYQ